VLVNRALLQHLGGVLTEILVQGSRSAKGAHTPWSNTWPYVALNMPIL
jgi:hypothetical protein